VGAGGVVGLVFWPEVGLLVGSTVVLPPQATKLITVASKRITARNFFIVIATFLCCSPIKYLEILVTIQNITYILG
jgi:hypothetical protein